ncbi:hypothetical protein EVAR_17915_1 [Eumeta japonica]|uniref:Uncharacterized protein n=1 Tax=Eumeta variegata TaxID=151549 RepID=A0A4C1UZH6_EUMVA|nr:hypothetical protein EVAR_17915_1 [Eumeta japonica]
MIQLGLNYVALRRDVNARLALSGATSPVLRMFGLDRLLVEDVAVDEQPPALLHLTNRPPSTGDQDTLDHSRADKSV